MTDTSTRTEYGYATLDINESVSDVGDVVGDAGTLTSTALFIDFVVSNRGNPVLQFTFNPAEEFIRRGIPHAQAIERAGKVMGAISMLNDLLDMANNGVNVQNGANFLVDAAGTFGGPLLGAFATGYAIGHFLDDLIGISDRVGRLADRGDASVNMELSSAMESLARRGDQQCARLKERYELYARYENLGARLVNSEGRDAATVDPAALRERGYDLMRREAHHALPRPTDLHDHIERDEALLRDRLAELRDLQARERAIWATLEDDRGGSSASRGSATNAGGRTTPRGPQQ